MENHEDVDVGLHDSEEATNEFGEAMRRARTQVSAVLSFTFSGRHVASEIGLTPGRYFKIENGQRPDQGVLDRLRRFYAGFPDIVESLENAYFRVFRPVQTEPRKRTALDIAADVHPHNLHRWLKRTYEHHWDLLGSGSLGSAVRAADLAWRYARGQARQIKHVSDIGFLLATACSEEGDHSSAAHIADDVRTFCLDVHDRAGANFAMFLKLTFIARARALPISFFLREVAPFLVWEGDSRRVPLTRQGEQLAAAKVLLLTFCVTDQMYQAEAEWLRSLRKDLEELVSEAGDPFLFSLAFARIDALSGDPYLATQELSKLELAAPDVFFRMMCARSRIISSWRSDRIDTALADGDAWVEYCTAKHLHYQRELFVRVLEQIRNEDARSPSKRSHAIRYGYQSTTDLQVFSFAKPPGAPENVE